MALSVNIAMLLSVCPVPTVTIYKAIIALSANQIAINAKIRHPASLATSTTMIKMECVILVAKLAKFVLIALHVISASTPSIYSTQLASNAHFCACPATNQFCALVASQDTM